MHLISSKTWVRKRTIRTLLFDASGSDLEIGKLDCALDATIPVSLRGDQIGGVRELDRAIAGV